jgi:hypothetical protein
MANKASSQIIEGLLNQIDQLEAQSAQNLAFARTLVSGWKDGSLTADRIKILDNGSMRITNPEPSDMPTIPEVHTHSNGHQEETAETIPLADLQDGDKPKAKAGSNGNSD